MSHGRRFVIACVLLALNFLPSYAAVPRVENGIEVADLGQAPIGATDIFRVEVRNPACADPQSFRFVANDLAWLKFTHGDRLDSVARGERKTFVADIDLSGLSPGRYAGTLDIVCETCGQFGLSLCDIDKRRVFVQVEVVRP